MAQMRLLLVEDNPDLSSFTQEGLSREGFSVDVAPDGQSALDQATEETYDVILLDVMMPHVDGFTVLKKLRAQGYRGAILLVTCKGQERDKLNGLNSGADDYIVKPFLMTELVARIRAVLRRTTTGNVKAGPATVLKAGELALDLLKREARRGKNLLSLTKKEFDLLECFMRRPGQVLSQTVLSQHLTGNDFSSNTNVIEVHIKNLREKIDGKNGDSLIRTVRGCGYSLDI